MIKPKREWEKDKYPQGYVMEEEDGFLYMRVGKQWWMVRDRCVFPLDELLEKQVEEIEKEFVNYLPAFPNPRNKKFRETVDLMSQIFKHIKVKLNQTEE